MHTCIRNVLERSINNVKFKKLYLQKNFLVRSRGLRGRNALHILNFGAKRR
jgi:hypothetical protein